MCVGHKTIGCNVQSQQQKGRTEIRAMLILLLFVLFVQSVYVRVVSANVTAVFRFQVIKVNLPVTCCSHVVLKHLKSLKFFKLFGK